MVDGESAMRAATMCLVTAFFDPATWTSPRSGPLGSMCQAGPAGSAEAAGVEASMAGQGTRRPVVVDMVGAGRNPHGGRRPDDRWRSR